MPSAAAQLSGWSPMATVRRMLSASLDGLGRFAVALLEFIVGDSGVETGWPCLRCSSLSAPVRDFIVNRGDVDGWRFKTMHGGGLVGAIAEHFGIDPNSIVLHAEGEECPRIRIAECDTCGPVELHPATDECPDPDGVNHRVFNKRPKPRSQFTTGGDAGTPQETAQC